MAGESEQVGERISDHCPSAVPHMHRTGRVGRDKLYIHRLARADGRHAVAVLLVRNHRQLVLPGLVGQPDIYKARASDGHVCNILQHGQPARQLLSELARMRAGKFCQDHRRVGRQIAMRRVVRTLHGQPRPVEARRNVPRHLQIANYPREMIKDARMKRHSHQRRPAAPWLLSNLYAFPESDVIPDGFRNRIRIGI